MPPEANALLSSARRLRQNLEMEHGISVPDTVARDLYGEAGYIVDSVVSRFEPKKSLRERIDAILTSPNFGIAGAHICPAPYFPSCLSGRRFP